MAARMAGARAARGRVLVFLDAHCEAGADWLRPLLQRAAHKRDAVLTPLIDVLDQASFRLDAAEHFQVRCTGRGRRRSRRDNVPALKERSKIRSRWRTLMAVVLGGRSG
ncbi:jg10309 [Pararge aegeria aegeria]|uniref:Jg10309 protein n=1 Tax=Pararge aegeria aegeria TaxID=348720 RepID=A0A8S4S491_9NEOP|nr:jg10309 [Pararge aegeria aegeria]